MALFAALQNLSERLWGIHRDLCREADSASFNATLFTAVEIHGVLTLTERFPGLAIPTSPYSMRFANLMAIVDLLDARTPRTIVELGSGISTLCVAAWLREQSSGKVWSFEHDPQWFEITQRHLERCGLCSFAEVILTPLCKRQCMGRDLEWYDLEKHLEPLRAIDMLIVDGPPASFDPSGMCRLPAADVFAGRLSPAGVVVIDDASRPGERAIVDVWMRALPQYVEAFVPTLTGLSILLPREHVAIGRVAQATRSPSVEGMNEDA